MFEFPSNSSAMGVTSSIISTFKLFIYRKNGEKLKIFITFTYGNSPWKDACYLRECVLGEVVQTFKPEFWKEKKEEEKLYVFKVFP